ncbi:MAG: hypothetical protein A2174_03670 [Candidatus Portnoybacteria bacterium RBG_13_41_18]|uniref:Uncharacterized protein n=1 Tax=Candidatus Portnoybacteria bacterium RBG_13_41_18 TaxID=1801991 RepID=A0A1G2F5W5_9BACT|nr:MAG: hypothetical protein A2174_03670 [Candidatus Portnoybacteria bacterium RBG_13_41_18]
MNEQSPEQPNKSEQEKPLDLDCVFGLYETQEGRELFANLAVRAGQTINPEYIELALNWCEREAPGEEKDKFHERQGLMIIEAFDMPEERRDLLRQNIMRYSKQYEQAQKDWIIFSQKNEKEEGIILKNAGITEKDAEDDKIMASLEEKAEKEGDYKLAVILHEKQLRRNMFANLRLKHGAEFYKTYKDMLDEMAKVHDKAHSGSRAHGENLARKYFSIGEYEEASKRIEMNPRNFAEGFGYDGARYLTEHPEHVFYQKLPLLKKLIKKHEQVDSLYKKYGAEIPYLLNCRKAKRKIENKQI